MDYSNPWLKFSPFIFLYALIIYKDYNPNLVGDESTYLNFATNLTNGFYSPPAPDFNLWAGPGYPLILAALVYTGLPYVLLLSFNVLFIFGAVMLVYHSIRLFASVRRSSIFALFLAAYLPITKHLHLLHTECFTFILVALIVYFVMRTALAASASKLNGLIIVLLITWLCLTKVIFGYVLTITLTLALVGLKTPLRDHLKNTIPTLTLALLLCAPWLYYTYTITGKPFLWADSGTMSLYTMSTPYEGAVGDWKSEDNLLKDSNHQNFILDITKLTPVEQNTAYQAKAIKNIISHPKTYARNWVCNISRMLFELPYTNNDIGLAPLKSIIPHIILLPLLVLSVFFHLNKPSSAPNIISLMALSFFIYFAGSSLVSAMGRMFFIAVPFLMVYVAYFTQGVRLKRKDKSLSIELKAPIL